MVKHKKKILRVLMLGLLMPLYIPKSALAQHQSTIKDISDHAVEITVQIEGSTQGSAVIVEKSGNIYTILTAKHAIKSHNDNEELTLITNDNYEHSYIPGSIKKYSMVDMATIQFKSINKYSVAEIAPSEEYFLGQKVYISGYPLKTSAVPTRSLRFVEGNVIGKANDQIDDGYQLLYSNPTLPGMSGGPVLNNKKQLIAIHGRGEVSYKDSTDKGLIVKTGTNLGIPIRHLSIRTGGINWFDGFLRIAFRLKQWFLSFIPFNNNSTSSVSTSPRTNNNPPFKPEYSDYLALAKIKLHLYLDRRREIFKNADNGENVLTTTFRSFSTAHSADLEEALVDLNNALNLRASPEAYLLQGEIYNQLRKDISQRQFLEECYGRLYSTSSCISLRSAEESLEEKVLLSMSSALAKDSHNKNALLVRATIYSTRYLERDRDQAIRELNKLISIDPENESALVLRRSIRYDDANRTEDKQLKIWNLGWALEDAIALLKLDPKGSNYRSWVIGSSYKLFKEGAPILSDPQRKKYLNLACRTYKIDKDIVDNKMFVRRHTSGRQIGEPLGLEGIWKACNIVLIESTRN